MAMTANPSGYQIRNARTGEMLSRHRTRQAVLDNWRRFQGTWVKIVRVYADRTEVVLVDGTWEPTS